MFQIIIVIIAPSIVSTLSGIAVELFSYWLEKKDDN